MASYCSTSDESDTSDTDRLAFPLLTRKQVSTDTWKDQLDFDRPCTGPEQRCWLCTQLTPWNRVMHGLAFELVELRPGKLRLRSNPQDDEDLERSGETVAAEASFLVSWLLQHHRCIDELDVAYGTHPGSGKKEEPFLIRLPRSTGSGPGRTIRGLKIEESASACWNTITFTYHDCYKLEDLGDLSGLETLKLDFNKIKPELAAEFAKLLRRNASSIKRFEISKATIPRQVNKALRYLFSCESLTISSYHDCLHRSPSMTSVARLLHSSTALKELSVAPIASRRQMDAIAKELETNTSLTKLGVYIGEQRCCPEPVFTALQRNTTLKELEVTDCRIMGVCGLALPLLLKKNTGLRLLYIGGVDMSELCLACLAVTLKVNTTLETLHISSEILPMNGVAALFNALRVNKTLKKLVLPDFQCSREHRHRLVQTTGSSRKTRQPGLSIELGLWGLEGVPSMNGTLPGSSTTKCHE
ncbi:hypothetical protein HPB48_007885 [Haemaphysalis longicornis]|uniref:Uncharacterized protein n=1 Tax=Haemaphysalis longicornis TaxID=44386 RepID=A0A9J6FUV8_HAELO|nr:hypothetical protein HPB48_007885 [Haemaphysalis longicornis]